MRRCCGSGLKAATTLALPWSAEERPAGSWSATLTTWDHSSSGESNIPIGPPRCPQWPPDAAGMCTCGITRLGSSGCQTASYAARAGMSWPRRRSTPTEPNIAGSFLQPTPCQPSMTYFRRGCFTPYAPQSPHAMRLPATLGVSGEREPKIEDAILETLPVSTGHRNRCVFEFARRLKGIFDVADPEALRPYLNRWHRAGVARGVIATIPVDESWIDFVVAWGRIRIPKRGSTMQGVFEAAKSTSMPIIAARYESAPMRNLVRLCRALQNQAGPGESWFLAARTAGQLLGVDQRTASKFLSLLVRDNVLVVAQADDLRTRRARCYRYLAD